MIESVLPVLSYGLEMTRLALVPGSDLLSYTANPLLNVITRLNPAENPEIYKAFQHGGNFLEGAVMPFLIYNGLSLIAPKLSERLKLATSTTIPLMIITGLELSDPWDIPAGILGIVAYVGVHKWAQKLASNFTR